MYAIAADAVEGEWQYWNICFSWLCQSTDKNADVFKC